MIQCAIYDQKLIMDMQIIGHRMDRNSQDNIAQIIMIKHNVVCHSPAKNQPSWESRLCRLQPLISHSKIQSITFIHYFYNKIDIPVEEELKF